MELAGYGSCPTAASPFAEDTRLAGNVAHAGGFSRLPDNHEIDANLFGDGCPSFIGGPCEQSLAYSQRQTEAAE